MQNPEIQKLLHSILTPALAGAAGTGAASAYFSQKNHDPAESKGERRRRILRNAMYGVALGGTAGAAVPEGAKMLGQPFFGQPADHRMALSRGADRAVDFGLKNFLPIAATGVGGYGIYHKDQTNKARALRGLAGSLSGHGVTPQDTEMLADKRTAGMARTFGKPDILRSELNEPGQIRRIMSLRSHDLKAKRGLSPNVFRVNEEIMATGHPGLRLDEIAKQFGGTPRLATRMLRQHLAGQEEMIPISKMMSHFAQDHVPAFQNLRNKKIVQALASKLPASGRGMDALERFNPSGVAEAYSRYIRPSVPSAWESVPPVAKLGLLGAGVFGASHLQKKLMGS